MVQGSFQCRDAPEGAQLSDNKNRSRGAFAPELCQPRRQNRFAPGTRMIPKSGVRFSDEIMRSKEGGEAPTGALSYQSPLARRRALVSFLPRLRGRVGRGAPAYRRSAAALATGYYPDGSAPEPGFPKDSSSQVFCPLASSHRLSTLRADRSFCRSTGAPEPPGNGSQSIRARGPHSLRLPKVPSRKAPSTSEMKAYVTQSVTEIKQPSRSQ